MPIEHITQSILVLRGHRVLLDTDLADLYGVTTKSFNQQVRRNRERFPADFMFQLTDEELAILRSQNVTSSSSLWGGRRYPPYAFTEHGAIMAATILNSGRAVEVSVYVVRAFVKLREVLASNKELSKKLEQLERKLDSHDQAIVGILKTLHNLMNEAPARAIGFTADLERMP
jgi:predicted DNA binding protein